MGRDITAGAFDSEDRRRYQEKVRRCLDVLARMLVGSAFATDPTTGLELELNLVDDEARPATNNAALLEALARPCWQAELARFNVEVNLAPRHLHERGLTGFEDVLRAELGDAENTAASMGTHLAMIGILPTLRREHVGAHVLSCNTRYSLLNEQILAARGEDGQICINGPEPLGTGVDSVAPEAACTSAQLHVQVSPESFASYWNAAQAVAGVQLALGANSPFLFGHRLWAETRIPLFEQAADTRSEVLKGQGARPRVWFGQRWITSGFDLFEENVRYFPALLPVCDEEEPERVRTAGGVPQLGELSLHNGTIYRWNRPVYAVSRDRPHLRVENRVLPAGPTVLDTVANAAFFFGLVRALAEADRPVWTTMDFATAEQNFRNGARDGIDAELRWPGPCPLARPAPVGCEPRAESLPATELVLRHLLPLACSGLDAWGVHADERDRLMSVIEGRCLRRRNGASWMVAALDRLETGGLARVPALRAMTRRYLAHMHAGEPVHTWPLD